jgi:hypothetical protein
MMMSIGKALASMMTENGESRFLPSISTAMHKRFHWIQLYRLDNYVFTAGAVR